MIDCKTNPVRWFYKQSTIKLKLSLSIKVSKQPRTSSLKPSYIRILFTDIILYYFFITEIHLAIPAQAACHKDNSHVCYRTVRCTRVKECLKVWAVSQFWPVEGDLLHQRPTWRAPRSISKPLIHFPHPLLLSYPLKFATFVQRILKLVTTSTWFLTNNYIETKPINVQD